MADTLKKLDVLPGWKTGITGALAVLVQIASHFGWVDIDPATLDRITDGLLALIGVFLAVKIERKK